MKPSRRLFLKGASALGFAAVTGTQPLLAAQADGFELAKLPYAFDALEPVIDAKTMEIHWGRHHKAYVDNLNKAFAGKADWLANLFHLDPGQSFKVVGHECGNPLEYRRTTRSVHVGPRTHVKRGTCSLDRPIDIVSLPFCKLRNQMTVRRRDPFNPRRGLWR